MQTGNSNNSNNSNNEQIRQYDLLIICNSKNYCLSQSTREGLFGHISFRTKQTFVGFYSNPSHQQINKNNYNINILKGKVIFSLF